MDNLPKRIKVEQSQIEFVFSNLFRGSDSMEITQIKRAALTTTKKPTKVPNFSHAAIRLADICAKEIWVGKNYKQDKILEAPIELEQKNSEGDYITTVKNSLTSDEVFLHVFSPHFLQYSKSKISWRYTRSLNITNLQAYIKVSRLSQKEIRGSNFNLQAGLTFLNSQAITEYKTWVRNESSKDYWKAAADLVAKFSLSMTNTPAQSGLGSFPTAASRILFMAAPDMPFFNMSLDIYQKLGIGSEDNNVKIKLFYETLAEGLERNWALLSEFDMPKFHNHHDELWLRIRNSGWWQRRIYDLALKNYFSNAPIEFNNHTRDIFLTKPHMYL